ncbi:MAG: lipopolysaccharide biosynthesis protein [Pseudonocardiales bacterium]|nr:MAG: lipopolysaccharide biosynthesis protein [Pseudonocardiales bacterium]
MTEGPSVTATPGDGLGASAARGAVVTLAGQIAQVVLQTGSVVILARILTPRDYGLYAIVLVIVGVGEIFRDFGLSSAAIQAAVLTRFQRDNLFWINAALGLLLALLTFLIAPGVAAVFHEPVLTPITRVLSLTFVINGLATQFRAGLNRDLKFGRLAFCDLAGQGVGLTTALVSAAAGARYWALVAAQLAQVATVLAILAIFARWVPRRPRRGTDLVPMLRYGISFVGAQIVGYAGNNLDSTVIGLRLGPRQLGLYNRAFQLVMTPLGQFRSPATTVALPVLSRLQADVARANDYLRRGQLAMGYTIVAALAIAAGASDRVVDLVMGPQWQAVPPVFALLAIAGSLQMLSFVGYWAYLSRGLTADLFRYTLVDFALRGVCIAVGSTWGIVGVAAGYAIAHAAEWPLSLWWLGKRTVIPARELYCGAFRIIATGTLAGGLSFLACRVLTGWADFPVLCVAALAGIGAYAGTAALCGPIRRDLYEVRVLAERFLHR